MKILSYITLFFTVSLTVIQVSAQIGDPLGGKDTLTLENERIEDVIDSEKPFLKPPYQELQEAKTDQVRYDSKDFYVETDFEPAPPNIREVEKERQEKYKNNLLKLGFGRFATPFAHLYLNNGEGRDVDYGLHFSHISAHQDGQIPLREFREDFGTLRASMLAKENRVNISGRVYNKAYYNYALTDTFAEVESLRDSLRMSFTHASLSATLASNYDRKRNYEYDLGIGINVHSDRRDNSEFHFNLKPTGGFRVVPDVLIGAKTGFTYIRGKIGGFTQNRIMADARPQVTYDNGTLMISGGVQVNYFNNSADTSYTQFGPAFEAGYEIVPDAITIVAGYNSGMTNNHYYGMIEQNPYLDPSVDFKPTIEKMNIYGGLEGNINQKMDFAARVYYKRIENQLIFDNSGDGRFFKTLYDSLMTVTGVHAELNYDLRDDIKGGVAVNVNSYNTSTVVNYFHASPVRIDFFGEYIYDQKLTARGEVFVFGPRPMGISDAGEVIRQNSFIDINLSADYRITNGFSVFFGVENLLATKYQRWNNYIERPIDIKGGITLAF